MSSNFFFFSWVALILFRCDSSEGDGVVGLPGQSRSDSGFPGHFHLLVGSIICTLTGYVPMSLSVNCFKVKHKQQQRGRLRDESFGTTARL